MRSLWWGTLSWERWLVSNWRGLAFILTALARLLLFCHRRCFRIRLIRSQNAGTWSDDRLIFLLRVFLFFTLLFRLRVFRIRTCFFAFLTLTALLGPSTTTFLGRTFSGFPTRSAARSLFWTWPFITALGFPWTFATLPRRVLARLLTAPLTRAPSSWLFLARSAAFGSCSFPGCGPGSSFSGPLLGSRFAGVAFSALGFPTRSFCTAFVSLLWGTTSLSRAATPRPTFIIVSSASWFSSHWWAKRWVRETSR